MHSQHEVDEVLGLVAAGWNNSQISRATGISTTTIRNWRLGRLPGQRSVGNASSGRIAGCPSCHGVSLDEPAYAYLLGLYLGDGCISRYPRTYRLAIVQDAGYLHLITLATHAIMRVRAGKASTVKKVGCIEIYGDWQHWPCVFPQHGPGRKHERAIVLAPWQTRIVETYPRQLLRGLIHSDGCRCINRVRKGKYAYPRYFFTNNSGEILQIFRDACNLLRVAHRNSKANVISIARREAVAALDAFVGPKA